MSDREEFENWVMSMDQVIASNDRLTLATTANRYESLAIELAWRSWKAARQAPASWEVGQAYVQGQIDSGIDPSFSNAKAYAKSIYQRDARKAPASGEVEPVGAINKSSKGEYELYPASPMADLANGIHKIYIHPPAKVPEGDRDKVVWGVYEHLCEKFDFNLDPVLDIVGYLVDEGLINAVPTPATTAGAEWVKPIGQHHDLKTDSSVFRQSIAGLKPWEIRRNDRGFSVGDTVTLRETENTGKEMAEGAPLVFTGRTVSGVIGYVLEGPVYGLSDEWCIFTLQATPPQEQ